MRLSVFTLRTVCIYWRKGEAMKKYAISRLDTPSQKGKYVCNLKRPLLSKMCSMVFRRGNDAADRRTVELSRGTVQQQYCDVDKAHDTSHFGV